MLSLGNGRHLASTITELKDKKDQEIARRRLVGWEGEKRANPN